MANKYRVEQEPSGEWMVKKGVGTYANESEMSFYYKWTVVHRLGECTADEAKAKFKAWLNPESAKPASFEFDSKGNEI